MKQQGWYDKPELVARLTRWFLIGCGLTLLADPIAQWLWPSHYDHLHYAWEGWFVGYAIIGFVAFVALVTLARLLRPILWRSVYFYDDRQPLPGEGEDR
ncbi:MAG: hypothetical protein AAGE94_07635 [Acidobacteriota bacterium]